MNHGHVRVERRVVLARGIAEQRVRELVERDAILRHIEIPCTDTGCPQRQIQALVILANESILRLDLVEHVIERIGEKTDFIVTRLRCAHRVVAATGDRVCSGGYREQGARDLPLQERGQQIGHDQ